MTEKTAQKMIEIKKLIASGMHIADAAKQLKMSVGTYYANYKNKEIKKSKTKKPYVESIPIQAPQSEKIICLIGTPQDIHATLKGLI